MNYIICYKYYINFNKVYNSDMFYNFVSWSYQFDIFVYVDFSEYLNLFKRIRYCSLIKQQVIK